jgi:hypothetical protein
MDCDMRISNHSSIDKVTGRNQNQQYAKDVENSFQRLLIL